MTGQRALRRTGGERKTLQPPTQSFANANAKLCNRHRKALHLLLQTFAVKVAFILNLPPCIFYRAYKRFCAYSATITHIT